MLFRWLFLLALSFSLSAHSKILVSGRLNVTDDQEIIAAMKMRRHVHFVQGNDLIVEKLLPEDRKGKPHQSWVARVSNGQRITVVYNLGMGSPVPVQPGDRFAVGGQLLWTKQGPLIHWTHDDPKKVRPDGYVYFQGMVYGDTDGDDR